MIRGEEFFLHIFVMGRPVVLGPIVGVVRWARSPEETRLQLSIDYSLRCGVVCLQQCGGLWVSHFLEDVAFLDSLAGVDVEGAYFCFSR